MNNLGKITMTIPEGTTRRGRRNGTQVSFTCDAIAYRSKTLLMVSAIGSESSVKALAAALHSNKDVEFRVERDADTDDENDGGTRAYGIGLYRTKANGDYTVYRHRLFGQFGLFQFVAIARVPGFLPVLSEESLWQELRGERFTTPLLRGSGAKYPHGRTEEARPSGGERRLQLRKDWRHQRHR